MNSAAQKYLENKRIERQERRKTILFALTLVLVLVIYGCLLFNY